MQKQHYRILDNPNIIIIIGVVIITKGQLLPLVEPNRMGEVIVRFRFRRAALEP